MRGALCCLGSLLTIVYGRTVKKSVVFLETKVKETEKFYVSACRQAITMRCPILWKAKVDQYTNKNKLINEQWFHLCIVCWCKVRNEKCSEEWNYDMTDGKRKKKFVNQNFNSMGISGDKKTNRTKVENEWMWWYINKNLSDIMGMRQ